MVRMDYCRYSEKVGTKNVQEWVLTRLAKEGTYLTNTFLQGTEKHHGVGHFFQVKLLVFVHFATPWMVRIKEMFVLWGLIQVIFKWFAGCPTQVPESSREFYPSKRRGHLKNKDGLTNIEKHLVI